MASKPKFVNIARSTPEGVKEWRRTGKVRKSIKPKGKKGKKGKARKP